MLESKFTIMAISFFTLLKTPCGSQVVHGWHHVLIDKGRLKKTYACMLEPNTCTLKLPNLEIMKNIR